MTADHFPHILANVVDIEKEHLLLHPPVSSVEQNTQVILCENNCKTLSTAAYTLYICKVTKPTCTAFSAWLNTGSIRSLKVTGKAIMLCSLT